MDIEDVEDFAELAEFVFDQSTPESDDETHIIESPGAPRSCLSVPTGRTGWRRARKACVGCHNR
jgi:hypothetical protein